MSHPHRWIGILLIFLSAVYTPSLKAFATKKRTPRPPAPDKRLTIKAELSGASALPSNSEAASGDVTGTYDAATHVLRFQAYFVNLTGPATNARFYGAAAIDRFGWAVVAAPQPDARLVSGTAWLDQEEEQDLLAGRWYFNVTTQKHPQGEIRGAVTIARPTSEL